MNATIECEQTRSRIDHTVRRLIYVKRIIAVVGIIGMRNGEIVIARSGDRVYCWALLAV